RGEAQESAASIREGLAAIPGVERVLCPPAISLAAVHSVVTGSEVRLGAQNMYFEEKGAYTGETSPLMLHGLCDYVILGHSQRRLNFGESDSLINKKALAARHHEVRQVVCVSERLVARGTNKTERVITTQIYGSLTNLPGERLGELVVAYEPVWAIGTGRAATARDAADAVAIIRGLLSELYGAEAAQKVRVQYGGSVTAANV